MRRESKTSRRAATLALLAAALLVVRPGAEQRGAGAPPPARGGLRIEYIDGRPAVERDVLVKFRRALGAADFAQLAADTDADENEAVGGYGLRRIHSKSHAAGKLLAFLRTHPDVEYAEPNYVVAADTIPNDTYFGSLWGLLNNGQVIGTAGVPGADISATLAWNVSRGSADIAVGIIDTGIDYTHPDLAPNVWSAPQSFNVTIGGRSITCAQYSHGFNAINNTCNPFDDNG